MTSRAKKLLEEAFALSASDRAMLAAELSEHAEDPEEVHVAWVKEAVKRLEQVERGEVELVSYDEVRARIRQVLDASSG